MSQYRKLWITFAIVLIASFAVLGYFGFEIYRVEPPVPGRVVDPSGRVIFTGEQIKTGRQVWQSLGGHELGSIW